MNKRLTITLPEQTVRLLNQVAGRGISSGLKAVAHRNCSTGVICVPCAVKGDLPVGVLTAEPAVLQVDGRAVDVVPEPKATATDAVLPVAAGDLLQFLDRMASRTVVRIGVQD